ncbi:MAG: hypothetical protein QMD23_04025 [Candidatus Bathyarchaeia archaeon]|nr:hypothetical protein [Candidatus Bathyarchaeia archaeon]
MDAIRIVDVSEGAIYYYRCLEFHEKFPPNNLREDMVTCREHFLQEATILAFPFLKYLKIFE